MQYNHKAIISLFFCGASAPVYAQSAFDGFRLGLEAVYSETSLELDASKPKDTALADAQITLSQGKRQLAAATTQLAEQRRAFEAGSSALANEQQRLRELEQQAAVSPQAAAALAPAAVRLRQGTVLEATSLQTRSAAIIVGNRAIEDGKARLAERDRLATELNTFPGVSTVTIPGTSVRFSLGWGTSWATSMGRIYLGAEIDAAPGVGDAVVRVPARYDTQVKGGPTFGASTRLGWIPVSWAMPYVTAGMETQQLHIKRETTRSTQHFTGFRMGLGIEFSIAENDTIRLGYDHTITSDIRFAGAIVTPSRDTYRVGYVRRF